MSFVSLLEDILDRLAEDRAAGRQDVSRAYKNDPELDAVLLKIDRAAEDVRLVVREILDLATDPSVDLAGRILSLEKENRRLKWDLKNADLLTKPAAESVKKGAGPRQSEAKRGKR